MSVTEQHAGSKEHALTLENADASLSATILCYGSTLQKLFVTDSEGKRRDIVAGFDDLAGYIYHGQDGEENPYFGATVGRVCNRIAKGSFSSNNRTYQLATNNGENHLHGGHRGFNTHQFTPKIVSQSPPTIVLTYLSPDNEESYPGALSVSVTYTLTETALQISYAASLPAEHNPEDLQTIVNLTDHSYFNLTGFQGDESVGIKAHEVSMPNVTGGLALTSTQIPTGETFPISKRPDLDFTTLPKTLGADLAEVQKEGFKGYDHFFLLRDPTLPTPPSKLVTAATLKCAESGITMTVQTDACGFQMYTANFLTGTVPRKSGQGKGKYGPQSAVCFEPSAPVDAINHEGWKHAVIVERGDVWKQQMVYVFGVEGKGVASA